MMQSTYRSDVVSRVRQLCMRAQRLLHGPAILLAFSLLACGQVSAQVRQPDFGSCDASMYLAQNSPTGLFKFETSTNPFAVDPMGPTSTQNYNAIAFNPVDNYLYGALLSSAPGTLARIGSDGSVVSLGVAAGLGAHSVVGEIGPDGTYYLSAANRLYRVNLATMTSTFVPLSQSIVFQDMAWHNGLLYAAVAGGALYSINPATGAVTQIGSTTGVGGPFGAMFGASNGVFGGNNSGGFYRFDLTTGTATLISNLPGSGNNDGAKCATTPLEFPADLAIDKDDGSDTYAPGEDVVYTIVVSNLGPFGAAGATVDDALPAGITTASWTCGSGTGGGSCSVANGIGAIDGVPVNLPAGATVTFTLRLSVPNDFTGELVNVATVTSPPEGSPDPNPGNNTDTDTDVTPVITVNKSVDPGSGSAVSPGDTLTYTLTVDVADSATIEPEILVDTLGAGLTVGTLPAGCTVSGQVITCTLATGAAIGTHTFTYTATVDTDAETQVENSVVPSTGTCLTCTTTNPVSPKVTVNKSVNPGSGTAVSVGDTLTYTLTVTVANAATTQPEVLVDTLGAGLTAGTLPAGCTVSGQVITCTLATGAAIGTHTFEYTATVDATATTSVSNSVVPSTGTCTNCTTTNLVTPEITVNKSVNPGSGTAVSVGDTLTYTLTVTVSNAATTQPEVLVDTLGAGLTVGTLPAGCTVSGQVITCTLATGAAIGTHTFTYTATVDTDAETKVENSVVPSTGTCLTCTTTNLVTPEITVNKSVNPGSGTAVSVGDTLTYTLTVTVANAATINPEVLVDTLGAGLTAGTLPAGCTVSGQVITCTLAAGAAIGTHTFEYTATVDATATTSVSNSVVPSTGTCTNCTTTNLVTPEITVNKSVNPGSGTAVSVGDTLTYTLTVTVANAATINPEVLVDTLGAGLTVGTLPAGCAVSGQVITCTLAAGAAIGTHDFEYTATVDAAATTSVSNSVVPSTGTCLTCKTVNPVDPTITVNKSVNPGSGTTVSVGDTLTYTLTVTVTNAITTQPEMLVDTLGAGLTVGTLPAGCTVSGQVITCTLATGAAIGTHTFEYTATVDATATTSVSNSVVPSTGTCLTCTTTNLVTPEITVNKSVNPGSGTAVSVGDTLTYTLTVTVSNAATTQPEILVDTLGAGLTAGTLPAGCTVSGQVITCTLATGAAIGTHTFEYTATVDAAATTSVSNSVVPSTATCATCTTTNPILPKTSVLKSSDPASGETVMANDLITYTVSVTVANSATIEAITLTDTLSGAQALQADSIVAPAGGTCTVSGGALTCVLTAGATPGVHSFVYQTRVDADASGNIGNQVVATGGGGEDPDCISCSTQHRIAEPVINISKSADPGNDAQLHVGDVIDYTLTVTVADAATTSDLVLDDTPGPGLTVGALPAGCTASGTGLRCVLPSGSVPDTYTFNYPVTINPDAGDTVRNAVLANGGGSTRNQPACLSCETEHKVINDALLRVVKTSSVREARVGDLVRYTLTVQNIGATNVHDADIIDTPPAGFSYVEGSLMVADGDNAGSVEGHNPVRFGDLDIDAGTSATLVYLMRVGASVRPGVRPGVLVNQAQAFTNGGNPISNIATAEVTLAADPLTDESLILGTVFDDRDGDGWQDNAELTGIHVQGGFAASVYVPGSTTIDRGDGAKAEADASAPLLHGIALGGIGARQSIADPTERRQMVVSQRLTDLRFTDDFVLTTRQGVTVRMDAAGNSTIERSGEAAKSLNAAAPVVTRRIAQGEGGYVVDYVIGNAGIDERGIPGVRIASVDGLLMETDQFGRYHLAGVPGGAWERGRNFILKVDPATLPPGTEITTDNPLIRRITPGLPVRFDFGAKLPVEEIQGGEQQVELELGEVLFDPGSTRVRESYLPLIEQIAAKVAEYRGGEVVIDANGDSEGLAFERATAVKAALLAQLPAESAEALTVSVRTVVDDPSTLVAGIAEGGVLLGTVLFDTDRSMLKPEFVPLLDRVAAWLEQQRGGAVVIVGHTDLRGSDAYNLALGMRRARAVYEAIATRLSPEVRSKVRVESSNDPAVPAGASRK
ncbi:isopeptide-forming domain-containing fimbrial protein [Stenotrophomonas humi]